MDNNTEFDVQKTILKKKDVKSSKFFVGYNKITGQVYSVSPAEPENLPFFETDNYLLVKNLFDNKITLHKLKAVRNNLGQLVLAEKTSTRRSEFNYITAEINLQAFVQLSCDLVSKRITIKFIDELFKLAYTNNSINEEILGSLPDYIEVNCFNAFDPGKFSGKIIIDVDAIFKNKQQSIQAVWLPDDPVEFSQLKFMHYDFGLKISPEYQDRPSEAKNKNERPVIVYKQTQNQLELQSLIEQADNFRLAATIEFFITEYNDPGKILDVVSVNSSRLNDYAKTTISLATNKPVQVISNYDYLSIKDVNESTYYEF